MKFKKIKMFFKKWKNFIIAFFVIIITPILVGHIGCCCFTSFLFNFSKTDLLKYFGSVLGLLLSAYTVTDKIEKKKINNIVDTLPILTVEVKNKGEIFEMTICNLSKHKLKNIFLYDEQVEKVLNPSESFSQEIMFNDSVKRGKNCILYNSDKDIIENGFPKYVQLCCDNIDGKFWNLMFIRDKKTKNYVFTSCEEI